MGLTTVLLIALGLSMDAFAVSVAAGLGSRAVGARHALRMAAFFGIFQALMPVLGWSLGSAFHRAASPLGDFISGFDHWVAFGLLSVIGGKMIFEAFALKKEESRSSQDIYSLLVLSVATSIDALAVGLTLSVLDVPVLTPALVIGAVTFSLSLAGVALGRRFGHLLEGKVEVAGGLMLIGIGVKILVEHLG